MQGLPADSLTMALLNGGREFYGYTSLDARLDNIFDALNVNTQATGNWKKSPPDFPLAPRPKAHDAPEKQSVSVAALYRKFANRK